MTRAAPPRPSRKGLDQTGDGHFSPLAAYDAASDSVLVLDVARCAAAAPAAPRARDERGYRNPAASRRRPFLIRPGFDHQFDQFDQLIVIVNLTSLTGLTRV